jgi:hypothetical protein
MVLAWINLKTLCAKDRRFKSPLDVVFLTLALSEGSKEGMRCRENSWSQRMRWPV